MSLKPVQYRNGEIIIRKGDMASEMYFVVRGVVQVYDECTEQVFAQFQPGSFFGEVGLFFKIKRSATVRCHSPVVTVFKLLKSDLDTILTNYPEVRQKIEAEAAQRYKYIEARENANIDTDQHISTDIEVVRERLKTIPLFKDTSTAFLHQLALAAKLVVVNQGDVIIRKGEIGRNMYFVIDGAVQVVSEDLQTVYAEMAKLSFFGEVSMFYEVNRTATVRASARSTLVDLSKEALESVLAQYTTIRTQVQAKAVENYKLYLKRQRALEGMGKGSGQSEQFDIEATTNRLKKMSIFQHCQEGFLKVLALSTSIRSLRRGELVIRRGDPSLEMFFIVKGSVEIISNDGSSVYDVVSDGDFFGEVGVIRNVNRTAAVRVSSDSCDFIVLSADAMRTALGEYPDSFQVVLIEAQKRFQLAEERTLRGEHALIHNRDGSTTDLAPSTSEASLSRQPTAKRAVTIKPSALQRPLTDASNSERESDSRSPSKQASACVSPTSPTADKGKQQAQQQQQPALLDQINTEELQRNTEKEKTSRSFGQLFSRHAPRKKREELESSHLKKNAMSVSQDSVVDPEPKRGMSMHVPASATGAALTQEPQAVGTPASSMSSGRESIVGSSNTSLATSTGKDREGSQTQVQKALGKMLQTIKNSLQRKESPKVAPVPIKESVSTTSSMSDSAKLNTLMSVVREDVLRRLYSPPHAPVQSILDADEHQLSVILARVPPLDILRLRGVCRRWNELLLLPQFWSKLNLKPEFRKINRRAIEVLGYLGGDHLVRIDLAGCWMVYDEDLGSLASQCPNIKTLSVSNCWKLTDLGLSFVAEHCTKLLNLNISYCGQMTGTGFAEHQWRALRRINLSYCKQLGDEHLERLLSRTTDLQDIKMRRCQRISDFGIFLIVRYCR
ncbi:cyclic nucleotide-binding-like protein [Entophlyctis helioformis]|nr:cyclic nucleotide-binding-like protein [Entophlyctis helioformis]